jgi:transcriptional regulator with XRE-family HTH domain
MIADNPKITAWTSFCAILLREARAERSLHQAQVADALGQTASAWTKVETGKSPLQFETLFRVCSYLRTQPSTVMGVAERYGMIFQQDGWAVLFSQSSALEQDHLLMMAQAYWSSPGGRIATSNHWGFSSILSGPTYNSDGTMTIAPVFRYALDSNFRNSQDNYTPISLQIADLTISGK